MHPTKHTPTHRRRWLSVLVTLFIMLSGWLVCFVLDEVLQGAEMFGSILTGMHWRLAVVIVLIYGISIWAMNKAHPQYFRILLCVLFVIPVLWIYFFNGETRKPFLRDLAAVKAGMSRAEVEMLMGGYIEGSGLPANPFVKTGVPEDLKIPNSLIFRHTGRGWGDADWGIVKFDALGKVAAVEFSHD